MQEFTKADEGTGGGAGRDVEIGWLLEGDLTSEERAAARSAAAQMERSLAACMPGFDWVIETLERPTVSESGRIEPVRLLDTAITDRDLQGWDFVFVVTRRELQGRDRQRILGATAGIFATALISTAFLSDPATGQDRLSARLNALALHLLGRLNALPPDETATWMGRVDQPGDLDGARGFGSDALDALSARMEEIADLRVEEMQGRCQGRFGFYARSIWQNRSALPRAILRMRPWSFPLRLRRLTTAAGSALALLVMTAESWEVAANLSVSALLVMSVAAILGTSLYLIRVQRLLASRRGPLREQRAVSNAGTVVAVIAGMAFTYAGVFAVGWLLAAGLFGDALLEAWTGATEDTVARVRVRLAALAAPLSVAIGALGASFEPYGYFRHVTQIDEEIGS